MKNILFIILSLTIVFVACKKDKTLCLQSDVTLDYHTLNQYDSTYQIAKMCMEESKWETLTFEGNYDPVTGTMTNVVTKVGTYSSTYYNTVRGDSVTRTTVTYSVPE